MIAGDVKNFGPNLNRRTGCAGLDGHQMNNLFSNGKLVVPYSRNATKSCSEDENVSVTISESTFNMKLSNHQNNLDLNDQLLMKSLRQGLHIDDLTSTDSNTSEKYNKDCGQEKRGRSGRESHSSRRSKRSRQSRKKYSSQSDSCDDKSDTSSCAEIKQLVQSSLNSGASVCGADKNRSSRQSKTSIDVAVQANAHDIVSQTAATELEFMNSKRTSDETHKSKQMKTKENRKYKKASKYSESGSIENNKKSKEKYRNCGSSEEKRFLYKDLSRAYSDFSDQESLVKDNYKVNLLKSREGR